MKRITFALMLLGFAVPMLAMSPLFANRSAGEYQGNQYVIEIDREHIIAMPHWEPSSGQPQISPSDAWKLARSSIKSLIPDIDKFETVAISLERVGSSHGKRFVYVVHFVDYSSMSTKRDGGGGIPNQLRVWVSTNGTAFLPRISKGEGDEFIY